MASNLSYDEVSYDIYTRRLSDTTDSITDLPGNQASYPEAEQHDGKRPLHESLRSYEDVIVCLENLGVPGPLTVYCSWSQTDYLGQGAQFTVYSGGLLGPDSNCEFETAIEEVAIKIPIFDELKGKQLSLTSPTSRRQINNIYLEISALRLPKLYQSRNIVKLLGWAVGQSFHQAPMLVYELALGTMGSISHLHEITWRTKQQLCLDVGNGLDAIHEAKIVHGDLKPDNVLIFRGVSASVPFVAKLADFGASALMNDRSITTPMRGTPGWEAPEIERGEGIPLPQMFKADTYAYGLLVLSFTCLDSIAPNIRQRNDAVSVVRNNTGLPESFSNLLSSAMPCLLHALPHLRPSTVHNILLDSLDPCTQWELDEKCRLSARPGTTSGPFVHPWKLPSLSAYLFLGLESSFRRYSAQISGPHLFAMFLLKSYSDAGIEDKTLPLLMLVESAHKGYRPAIAVVGRVHKSYGKLCDSPEAQRMTDASSGSFMAISELAASRPDLAQLALSKFRADTGYNQFFSPVASTPLIMPSASDADNNSVLHVLAAQGSTIDLRASLADSRAVAWLNWRNRHGETALYKACLAGCWESVDMLCAHGADASILSFLNGLTCLHWLFNVPPERIHDVLSALLRSGANINAMAHDHPSPVLADHHFPFQWPLGTPLHSAVHTRNRTAVNALVLAGADVLLRDVRDPYIADQNVRQMHVHGNAETGETSRPEQRPLGFSPSDLAAALHDHEILKLLHQRVLVERKEMVHKSDEEGYTPFHRLSHYRVARTGDGLRFWYPAFRGIIEQSQLRRTKTIQVLQECGYRIDQLTNTPHSPGPSGVSGLSPLMIAVTKADCEAVSALLEAGADVNQVNRDGRSALMLLPHVSDEHVTPGSLSAIIGTLVNNGAKVNEKSLDGASPLTAVIATDSLPCTQQVISAGADLDTFERGLSVVALLMSQNGYNHLLLSPNKKSLREAEEREHALVLILEKVCSVHGDWPHQADKDNGSLLHWAAYAGLNKCAEILVQAGFNRNQIRTRHFTGRGPSNYYSTARYMRYEGTPWDVASEAAAEFNRKSRAEMSEPGQLRGITNEQRIRRLTTSSECTDGDRVASNYELLLDILKC